MGIYEICDEEVVDELTSKQVDKLTSYLTNDNINDDDKNFRTRITQIDTDFTKTIKNSL